MDPLYTFSGFAVGAIVGLTGVGGGSLMTPLLVLLFGIHPATAVGTDLLYAAFTKAGGTVAHAKQGHIDWKVTRLLAAGSIPAAALTILALSHLPPRSPAMTQTLSVALGFALFLTAAAILFGRRLRDYAARLGNDAPRRTSATARNTIIVGAIIGILVSISSVGAGALGVAALYFLYPHLAPKQIVGSDVAHAVPLTFVAGLGYWWMGSIDWSLLGALLLGSLPGIWVGSRISSKVPEHLLRRMLGTMLVLVGAKLISA